jgi:hypothetical protein
VGHEVPRIIIANLAAAVPMPQPAKRTFLNAPHIEAIDDA